MIAVVMLTVTFCWICDLTLFPRPVGGRTLGVQMWWGWSAKFLYLIVENQPSSLQTFLAKQQHAAKMAPIVVPTQAELDRRKVRFYMMAKFIPEGASC